MKREAASRGRGRRRRATGAAAAAAARRPAAVAAAAAAWLFVAAAAARPPSGARSSASRWPASPRRAPFRHQRCPSPPRARRPRAAQVAVEVADGVPEITRSCASRARGAVVLGGSPASTAALSYTRRPLPQTCPTPKRRRRRCSAPRLLVQPPPRTRPVLKRRGTWPPPRGSGRWHKRRPR